MNAPRGQRKLGVVLRRLSGRYIYLSIVKKESLLEPKFYFQISKKMVAKATDRNLLKRRLRSLLKAYLGVLKSDQALVLGVKTKMPPIPSQLILKQDLNKLLL